MFKKKVWKRGDKLNAKELNRIESGGLLPVITCDEEISNNAGEPPVFNNFSITAQELREITYNYQHAIIEINLKTGGEKFGSIRTSSMFVKDGKLEFLIYAQGMGLMLGTMSTGKETDDDDIVVSYKVLLPDSD